MARTTASEVKKISDTALSDTQIGQIIEIANRLVTDVVGSEGLSSSALKDIETFLTAHLIAIGKERQPYEERIDEVWVKYSSGQIKEGLRSTTYGQHVLFLDSTGNFQKRDMKKASIRAVRQTYDDLTDTE